MTSASTVLSTQGLSKTYVARQAVADLNLEAASGEVFGFLGQSETHGLDQGRSQEDGNGRTYGREPLIYDAEELRKAARQGRGA